MYKVLIADDEQIVIDGIKFMIEDYFDDMDIVAMANSGREAIELARTNVPDIILMDIMMPGINGIEAIEVIKKKYNDIKFIIISAYEQFEYAKQAVELGVSHYILKPVSEEKLTKVLKKVRAEIDEERLIRLQEIKNKEKLEQVIPALEHGFVYAMYMNADFRQELYKYQELFDLHEAYAYVMVLEFGESSIKEDNQNKIGLGIKGQSLYPKLQSAIKYKCRSIVGPMMVNRLTVVIHGNPKDQEYEARLNAIHLAAGLKKSLEDIVASEIYIGIGSSYPFDKIKNSLEESLFALNQLSSESILHVNDIQGSSQGQGDYSYVDIKEDETSIITYMENGQESLLEQAIKAFFLKVEKKFGQSMPDMRNIATELMVMALSSSYRNDMRDDIAGYSTYLHEIKELKSVVSIQRWCVHKIMKVSKLIQSHRHQHISTIVIEAKGYIDEHYEEELGLNDISKRVSVSPQYFSKIFKEEIGVNFVEYIRMKRVEVAKEMLRSGQYSVKEICYKIGYNDPNYFSRLFKKIVGVSPSEYDKHR